MLSLLNIYIYLQDLLIEYSIQGFEVVSLFITSQIFYDLIFIGLYQLIFN